MTSSEYAEVVQRAYPKAVRFARSICGEHAEDAVQDAVMSFLLPAVKTGVPAIARLTRMTESYFLSRVKARAIHRAARAGYRRGHEVPAGVDLSEFEPGSRGCTAMEGNPND